MARIFISGIDTDIGKTIATGLMARFLHKNNCKVITQKIVQTGCEKVSEDILAHRQIMGCELFEADKKALTCPYLFRHPASPHLAAHLENRQIDIDKITEATKALEKEYTTILIEGAGGLMVPLNSKVMVLDYISGHRYPVVLVSSSKLGSINHTLLSIEALKARNLELLGVVYNRFPQTDPLITKDSVNEIRKFMVKSGYPGNIVELDEIDAAHPDDVDFSLFFPGV